MATGGHQVDYKCDEEQTNYLRLCRVIVDLCSQVLRDVLAREIPPTVVAQKAIRCPSLKLNPAQYGKLSSASSLNSYQEFDITLLYALIRFLCPNIKPTVGWNSQHQPSSLETTEGDDVERIHLIRNQIYGHIANTRLKDPIYRKNLQTLQDVMVRMDERFGGQSSYCQTLTVIKYDNMDKETEKMMIKKFKEMEKSEKESSIETKKLRLEMEEDHKRRDQRKLTNTEKQTLKRINDHYSSKTFVRTKAVLEGKAKLEENGVLIYIGLPGDGKTENAIDIMGIYLQEHPDKCFKILTDISEWSDVDPNTDSIILLDDVLGSSNTNTNVIREGKNTWANICSCIRQGKVKVIFTVRKNILIKNQTELEKYPLFRKEHVVDLTLENYRLSDSEKENIFTAHCHAKGIEIVTEFGDENYQRAEQLDENTPIVISCWTVLDIVQSNPVIGYPFACFLFFCHTKYIKQGYEFFKKPTEDLKDEISSLNDLQSETLEKLEYCIMSYMVLQWGNIDLDNLDQSLFNEIIQSVGIQQSGRLQRDLRQASMEINHKYIIGEYPIFTFIHQTLLETVALCLGEDNAPLLLRFCSKKFILEFICPQNYEQTEGEVVIKLRQSDYKHLIQRIIDDLQYQITRGDDVDHDWWVIHHVTDDVQFVDLFIHYLTSETEKQILEHFMSNPTYLLGYIIKYDKAVLLDRLYNRLFCNHNGFNLFDVFLRAVDFSSKEILIWFLDNQIVPDSMPEWLENVDIDTLDGLIIHPNIRWLNIEFDTLIVVLIEACIYGYRDIIDKIFTKRPDVITQNKITVLFLFACVSGSIDVIDYLLQLKLKNINPKIIHLAKNDEKMTNLHIAAFFGGYDVLVKLVQLGLVIKDRSKNGMSTLMYAMEGFKYQQCDYWLRFTEHGVVDTLWTMINDCMSRSIYSRIGKMMGRFRNICDYTKILTYLIKHKDCDLQDLEMTLDNSDCTLAHYSVVYNSPTIIELLTKVRPSVLSPQNNNGHKPIHLAVLMGRYEIFKLLYSTDDNISENLITQGKQYAGKRVDEDNVCEFDFLNFLPWDCSDLFGTDTSFGDVKSYTKISETVSESTHHKTEQQLERKKITLEGFEIVDKDHHFLVFCDGEFLEE